MTTYTNFDILLAESEAFLGLWEDECPICYEAQDLEHALVNGEECPFARYAELVREFRYA